MTMTVASPSPETATSPSYDWRYDAVCVGEDPELFQPIGTTGPAAEQIAEAKRVCARCPVQACCREWAIDVLPHGVAGGLTAEERQDERERRGQAMWDAPRAVRRETNPLDFLSAAARETALATGPRDAVPDGTPLEVRSELTRSRLFVEFLGNRKSSSPGGVRWSDTGRDVLRAYRAREAQAGTRVTEQLSLPVCQEPLNAVSS